MTDQEAGDKLLEIFKESTRDLGGDEMGAVIHKDLDPFKSFAGTLVRLRIIEIAVIKAYRGLVKMTPADIKDIMHDVEMTVGLSQIRSGGMSTEEAQTIYPSVNFKQFVELSKKEANENRLADAVDILNESVEKIRSR